MGEVRQSVVAGRGAGGRAEVVGDWICWDFRVGVAKDQRHVCRWPAGECFGEPCESLALR